jgi:hypothetical protein
MVVLQAVKASGLSEFLIGSSIQVALVIAPLLVLLGMVFHQPMDLAFTMEVASIALVIGVASSVIRDSESNWLEAPFCFWRMQYWAWRSFSSDRSDSPATGKPTICSSRTRYAFPPTALLSRRT